MSLLWLMKFCKNSCKFDYCCGPVQDCLQSSLFVIVMQTSNNPQSVAATKIAVKQYNVLLAEDGGEGGLINKIIE